MAKYRYRNTSKEKQAVIGVGEAEAGEIIESGQPLYNPNLVLVSKGESAKKTEKAKEE